MKSRHESRSDDTKTRTASEIMNMYRDSTLRGAGGRMPKRRITNARTSTSTACRKRERNNLIGFFYAPEGGPSGGGGRPQNEGLPSCGAGGERLRDEPRRGTR